MNSSNWQRVNKSSPCKICGKTDWCSESDDGTVAICARIESQKRCGESGWLHRLQDRPLPEHRSVRVIKFQRPMTPVISWPRNVERFIHAIDPIQLSGLADSLGLSVKSLHRLHVGWSSEHQAWTFPMFDADCGVVGIRLRLPTGQKLCVRGSQTGLFIPNGISNEVLLLAEGPTDTAALLDCGFDAIGRPSCSSGTRLIIEYAKAHKPHRVIVVADGDEPGQRGAASLASVLRVYVQDVRIIMPPAGIKDVRAWKQAGANAGDIQAMIDAAKPLAMPVRNEGSYSCANR